MKTVLSFLSSSSYTRLYISTNRIAFYSLNNMNLKVKNTKNSGQKRNTLSREKNTKKDVRIVITF